MERLPGLTLKALLTASMPVPSREKQRQPATVLAAAAGGGEGGVDDEGVVNLMPAFIRLLDSLTKLHQASEGAFCHGDIKPANLMCRLHASRAPGQTHAAAGRDAVGIRLIDPVVMPQQPQQPQHYIAQHYCTVRYNPKAYTHAFADTLGLALCMLEILCDEQPFESFVRSVGEGCG